MAIRRGTPRSGGGKLLVTGNAEKFFTGKQQKIATADAVDNQVVDGLKNIYTQQLVAVKASGKTRAVLAKKGNNRILNIINLSGDNTPGSPVSVTLKSDAQPASIWSLSQNKNLSFDYRNGAVQFTVPAVSVHDVIVIK